MKIFLRRRANYPWKNIKSIIKEGDSSGRICNCHGPYDEKLVQSSWQRRAKPTIHGYLTLAYEMYEVEKGQIDAAFPIANDTDSLGMTVGANSKFLTGPIYCVLNINIISVRVDFCPIVCVSREWGVWAHRLRPIANIVRDWWRRDAFVDLRFLCFVLLFFLYANSNEFDGLQ